MYLSLQVNVSNISKVFSAIEADLRRLIIVHLEGQKETRKLLGEELYKTCTERQSKEQGFISDNLQDLLFYTDFADLYHILNAQKDLLPSVLAKHIKAMTPQLDKLIPIRNRIAHNRPLYFDDCLKAEQFLQDALEEHDVFWRTIKENVIQLNEVERVKDTKNMHNLPMPDYEETGFIGRKKQINDLKKLCFQSPYPVITVIGDGGVGKSSLVLKAAYDIIESPDCPFDSIAWTTSKTTQLTPQEIKNIENDIRSSLAMFQDVSDYLGPKGMENPLEEVLTYLSTFKILLILDNLETILDDQIRQFLGNLPSGGSKVLITSRIGVGAYEVPFPLQSLDEGEAIQLLRALADIRQVTKLVQMPNKQLGDFCKKMKNSPLFIKWFVSAIQTGRRPEEILDKRDLFLEFCMSNVYDYLSQDGQHVLSSMLCIPGKHSQAELAFLNDMDAFKLEGVIRQLRTTTMFTVSSNVRDASFESKYELSDLARDYLSKHHPVRFEEERIFKKRRQYLITANEQMSAEQESDPYSYYSITRRSQSDMIVATYLREALLAAKARQFKEADNYIAKARSLAPEYFEVHRVEGNIKAQQDNYSAARAAYEAAIALKPDSAPLRYWYAGFLLRYQNENEAALNEFKEAARLDPNSIDIQMETARTCLFMRSFNEARTIIDNLLTQTHQMRAIVRRKVYDLYFQCYTRKAEALVYQRDKVGAFEELERLKEAYEKVPPAWIDERIKRTLEKAGRLIVICANMVQKSEDGRRRSDMLLKWFEYNVQSKNEIETKWDIKARLRGTVIRLVSGRNFGFILADNKQEFFFWRSMMADSGDWDTLQEGVQVFFWNGGFSGGRLPNALNIIIEE